MNLLAIDGGGIRGVYASHILERIQDELKIEFHNKFDLISGTSTGAIIAAAVAFGIPVSRVTELYRIAGPSIFKSKRYAFGGIFASRYPSDPLREALVSVFEGARLSDAKTRLVIPATDIGNGRVHVFKSNYDKNFIRDYNVSVVDAVLSSCSAPTYFSPVRVGPYQLCDGGLWANNPSAVALIEAITRLGAERSAIRLLSIGTGIGKNYYAVSNKRKRWGFLTDWKVDKFISMLLNLQAEMSNNNARLMLESDQFVRVNFESDLPLFLDDVGFIGDLISRADRDFINSFKSIQDLLGASNETDRTF